MRQIKVRRGIDIAQNLFQNINFNRGRSQPPQQKTSRSSQNLQGSLESKSINQQLLHKQQQQQQKYEAATIKEQQLVSPNFNDQKVAAFRGKGSSNGSKSIILEQIVSSKNSGIVESSKHSGGLHDIQLKRLGINQSVAQIHTLSQLNSERGSIHESNIPGHLRPSLQAFSPQRMVINQQKPMALFDRLSSLQRSNTPSHKQYKGGQSTQHSGSARNHEGGGDGKQVFNLNQDQITVLSNKRSTRNFETKLGQAINNIELGADKRMIRTNCTESQLVGNSSQQKIVNVANSDQTEVYMNSSGRNKKKKGYKAVVQKYQQIPQSMISNNRPTFQQLEKAQSISNQSSMSDRQYINNAGPDQNQQRDNQNGINHIRQYYNDENYQSSPNGKIKVVEMKKFRVAVGNHVKGNSVIGMEHEESDAGKVSAKMPTSSEKSKLQLTTKDKPTNVKQVIDRQQYHSPNFKQSHITQNQSIDRSKRLGSDISDIESQSQHMSHWRRNQFPQDQQSAEAQGVQHYKVVNFRPYQEEVESLKVNNTNMVSSDHQHGVAESKLSKQSMSSPKQVFSSIKQEGSTRRETTDKPRTKSYYQRILNQIKRSPKIKSSESQSQFQFKDGEQASRTNNNESSNQFQNSMSGIDQDTGEVQGLHVNFSDSSNISKNRKYDIDKISAKHQSAVQFQVQTPSFQKPGLQNSLLDSKMKTIPVELINDKTNSHVDGDEQRVSDLFSPARGKVDVKNLNLQHNTMTNSQILNMKNQSEVIQNINLEISSNNANRRYTKHSTIKEGNALKVDKQNTDIQSNINHKKPQNFEVNQYQGTQSLAISPSNTFRNQQDKEQPYSQTSNNQNNLVLQQQSSSKTGPFDRYRNQQSEERAECHYNPSQDNVDQILDGNNQVKQSTQYSLFNFRRKQGALKSNERQQSPRASSKQILAKHNLSRLKKPFSKNRVAENSVSGQLGASSGIFELDHNRSKEDSNRKREFVAVGSLEQIKLNSQNSAQQPNQHSLKSQKIGPSQSHPQLQRTETAKNEHAIKKNHHQSSTLFGSSHDSCDIEATIIKPSNKMTHTTGPAAGIDSSYSPQRPAVTKFKHRTENDGLDSVKIPRGPNDGSGADTQRDERGANAELRIRNKKNIMSNIKQVHQNYKNNKLRKMDNQHKLVKQVTSDTTPPRNHNNKLFPKIDANEHEGDDNQLQVRSTINSSKLKSQDTASGVTKMNSACLQSSIQGQQIGDGTGVEEKDTQDEKDLSNNNIHDDPDHEVKGWAIFKLKSWKNIFVKSNEKSRENEQNGMGEELNKTGENNNDTKENDTILDAGGALAVPKDGSHPSQVKGDDDNTVPLVVKSRVAKDAQASSDSTDQVIMELKEMKHHIQCDCDKDSTYCFACKNGVVWFAANVIALKIRRQQKINKEVEVSKIILDEYEKCKKHYKSLKKLKPKQESALQIERDLGRTFPKNKFFQPGQPGHRKLRNVLRAFSCYDDQADYVQGMNFLVGQLLMHCSATLAFWLFVELIEECELRDIYQVGLPGLHKHSFIINMLVKDHLPDLHRHFEEHNVVPEMYASDWIFGLFASILPENQTNVTAHFFSLFFQYKWEFFYKLILSILEQLKPKLMEAQDMFSILQQIKIAMSNKNDPYTYGLIYQQEQEMQGQQKNRNKYTDHEMEDILGSIVSGQDDNTTIAINPQQHTSLFSNIANFFKKSKDDGHDQIWQEFPWEQVIIKNDIIQKWKKVDMKKINRLHANFDLDTGKFVNIEEERQQEEQQAKLGAAIATSLDKHQYNKD